jgi:hypothetical protein
MVQSRSQREYRHIRAEHANEKASEEQNNKVGALTVITGEYGMKTRLRVIIQR